MMNNDCLISPWSAKNTEEKIAIVLAGLQLARGVLAPLDSVFEQIKSAFAKFLEDPFDLRKGVEIAEQRLLYEHFGHNNLHAWEAIKLCEQYNFEVPIWAVNAVLQSAVALTRLGSAEGSTDSAIKKAIGIDGHKINQFDDNMFWLNVVFEIASMTEAGCSQKDAFIAISERYPDRAKSEYNVEKRYVEFNKILSVTPLPSCFGP